mmetsp:Transcript_87469/g.245569  ORF Transcript_87469/g.245569 Transcript_87469/m.245569 type:complete len:470 (-) Transcript_87469:133-1542(-)
MAMGIGANGSSGLSRPTIALAAHAWRRRWLVAIALFSSGGAGRQSGMAEATLEKGTIRLGGPDDADRWRYVTKFGYAIGEGSYSMRLRVNDEWKRLASLRRRAPMLSLDVFLDEDWARVEELPPCDRAQDGPARRTLHIDVSSEAGEYGMEQVGLLLQVVRPHIWYFAISDCRGELGNTTVDVDYEFHATQFDGSELSVEARYMPIAEGIALLGLTVLLFRGGALCRDFRRSAGALHPVIWALGAAVLVQYASQVAHLIHLLKYQSDGIGVWALDVIAEVFFMISQVSHATLLIAIAQGYTLLHGKECQVECSRLAFVATLAGHAALVGFDKLQEGTSSRRHHENDGVVGWVILFIRLALFVWFVSAVQATQRCGGYRLREFMQQFRLAGSLYFLAYPLVFVVTQVFAPYLRHPVMQFGLLATQASADVWLTGLFLSRGAYFKVSTLSSSLLPGGVGGRGSLIGLSKAD